MFLTPKVFNAKNMVLLITSMPVHNQGSDQSKFKSFAVNSIYNITTVINIEDSVFPYLLYFLLEIYD